MKQQPPRILLPADRPLGRQYFSCVHELGHHEFGHGTQVDQYFADDHDERELDAEERLVDLFACHLLMPQATVHKAFSIRGWSCNNPLPAQVYTIACALGVSYIGLLKQMSRGLNILSNEAADKMGRIPLDRIRHGLLGQTTRERLVPVDTCWKGIPIDLWVGNLVLLPPDTEIEDGRILSLLQVNQEILAQAIRPGTTRIRTGQWSSFIRVCCARYSGRAAFRFLEDPDAD